MSLPLENDEDFVASRGYWRVHFPGETMWVLPKSASTGILHNEPISPLHEAKWGDEVQVRPSPYCKGGLEFVRVVPSTMD